MNGDKPEETLHTRGEGRRALQEIATDETLRPQEAFSRAIQVLERLREVAAWERDCNQNPQRPMNRVRAALNGMCEPPLVPVEEEIEGLIAKLRAFQTLDGEELEAAHESFRQMYASEN